MYNTVERAAEGLDEIEGLVMEDPDGNYAGIAVDSTVDGMTRYNLSRAKLLNAFTETDEEDIFRALQRDSFEDNELVDQEKLDYLEKKYLE